ncbi:hypothetical protein [Halomonas sp. E19]|uniref:hypothetical protein n=1 Tax=Halomonas sp. E19 TaxID=3397247 RepID=UPI00403362CC
MPLLRHTRFTGPGEIEAARANADIGKIMARLIVILLGGNGLVSPVAAWCGIEGN